MQKVKNLQCDNTQATSPVGSHTFVEIDREIISTGIVLPSVNLRRVVVSYKQFYVTEAKSSLSWKSVVRRTDRSDMTIAVDRDVKH